MGRVRGRRGWGGGGELSGRGFLRWTWIKARMWCVSSYHLSLPDASDSQSLVPRLLSIFLSIYSSAFLPSGALRGLSHALYLFSRSFSLSLSLSLSHTHTHTHTYILSLPPSPSLSLPPYSPSLPPSPLMLERFHQPEKKKKKNRGREGEGRGEMI